MARNPKAEVEISAHSRTLGAKLREARAKFGSFGAELKKKIFGKDLIDKGFLSKAGASMVGNIGANLAGAAGGFLTQQGREVYAFNDALKRLQITTNSTPERMNDFGKSVRASSSETGIGADKILAGAQAYVALTGDMDGAAASSRQWARVAQATNSEVSDIAQTAAALKQQLNIKPEQMEAAFSALAVQGKAGAIEIKDLAAQMSSIAPQWAQFAGGQDLGGLKELGAALQIVKRGFGGDAGETVTGLQSLLTSVVQHSKQLKKGGVDVFTKNAKTGKMELKGVLGIVDAIAESKLAKNPNKLIKALGRQEAYRAFIQLQQNRGELEKLVDLSSDAGAIQRDLDTYTQSSAGRVKIAWEKAKNEIAEAFTPERIEAFAAAASKAAGLLASAVGPLTKLLDLPSALIDLGHEIGGGESEEKRIAKLQAARLEERKGFLRRQILAENPRLQDAKVVDTGVLGKYTTDERDSERIDSMVAKRLGEEDALQGAIGRGQRLTDLNTPDVRMPRLSRDKAGGYLVDEQVVPGTGRSVKKDDGYSVQDLVALKSMLAGGSNDPAMQKTIDLAIDRAASKLAKDLASAIAGAGVGKPADVKLDGASVGKGVANSRRHASRPGT